MILLLRLYLDANEGVASIPCTVCGRPMLLAVEKMGRMLVGYRGGFVIRPGHTAMLVCPEFDCDYREAVEIARTPADAVAFSAFSAAQRYQREHRYYGRTLFETNAEFERLVELYERTGNPKLPSAIRLWRDRVSRSYWQIRGPLEKSFEEGTEVSCRFKETALRGTVKALLEDDAVMLERTDDGEPVLVQFGDLDTVYHCSNWWPRRQFDFGDERGKLAPNNGVCYSATRFVVYNGQTLALDGVTTHGICRTHTSNPEVARAVGLHVQQAGCYMGEFPAVLADRCFKIIRYCWVGKYRLHMTSDTRDPYVVQLQTRNMEAARALGMRRQPRYVGQRKAPRWWRFFDRAEITDEEEIVVPIRMPKARRR